MSGRLEKPRGPEEDPQKKRKRNSDSTREIQERSTKKKSSGFDRFRRLQEYDAELKALSRQVDTEGAPKQLESSKPLGDITNTVKPFSISELKPKEVKETIGTKKLEQDNRINMPFNKFSPFSVDIMQESLRMHQEIPKPHQADANKDKGQN